MIAPSRKGAHPEHWLRPPSLDLVDGWSREAGVVMATIAPELPGALEVIERLVAQGVVVSVGHTAAGTAEVRRRRRSRCPVRHPPRQRDGAAAVPRARSGRAPRSVGDLVAGLIVDGHHLDPLFVRTAWRALGPGALPLRLRHHRRRSGCPTARPGSATRTSSSPTAPCGSPTAPWPARPPRCSTACGSWSRRPAARSRTRSPPRPSTPLTLLGLPPREERIELTDDLRLV